MSQCDPVADLLTRIRNANSIKRAVCDIPASHFKQAVVKVMKDEGYITDFSIFEAFTRTRTKVKMLRVRLKYGPRGEQLIQKIQMVSKQGRRIYKNMRTLEKVQDGLGIGILSTSHGVMSDREARKLKIGGELICKIW